MLDQISAASADPLVCNWKDDTYKQIVCNGVTFTEGDTLDAPGTSMFWVDIGVVTGLVLLAGLVSGLTMGLMSMDKLNLRIMLNSTDEKQRGYAAKILPLVERHHLLLVTLLLTNAVAAEALPIFLDRLVHPAVAIAVSVSLVLLFGEVIPQAVCTRYGLQIGAAMAWFVWVMIGCLFVIAYPISLLLDALLGHDSGTFFRRAELKELVHIHGVDEHVPMGENLTTDEVRIIKGALDMKEKTVETSLTAVDSVFAVDIDDDLDRALLTKIVESGHTRIPVYHKTKDHFIGMILVRDLVLLDPNSSTPVRSIKLHRVPIVDAEMPLFDMLHQFQTGRSHMAVVLNSADHITPIGVITLEDVMEELLQEEILDEDDLRQQQEKEMIKDLKIAKALAPRKYSIAGRKMSVFFNTQDNQQYPPGFAYGRRRGTGLPALSESTALTASNQSGGMGSGPIGPAYHSINSYRLPPKSAMASSTNSASGVLSEN
eukprot:TRINITY_DN1206_c0_g2_i1.p1 TRINITY_DN1206_c0_g2~~TRINITY_DN1206_c0_g2_i1.p1  ORF type:complete len:486 (-),score=166.93 TRINITY_DN1206_c0_g2_i1:282-1739(-)